MVEIVNCDHCGRLILSDYDECPLCKTDRLGDELRVTKAEIERLKGENDRLKAMMDPGPANGAKVQIRVGGLGKRMMAVASVSPAVFRASREWGVSDLERLAVAAARDAVAEWGRVVNSLTQV